MTSSTSSMRKQYLRGFTLVELLVVIAIIGILMSLLFPSLRDAIERGKRAACKSNLHQAYIAIQTYTQGHKGDPPRSEVWDEADPSAWASDFTADDKLPTVGATAWQRMIDGGYFSLEVLHCPSCDIAPKTNYWVSYGYRFNTISVDEQADGAQWSRDILFTAESWRVLLTEAAGYRRWPTGEIITESGRSDWDAELNQKKWAHIDGGHIVNFSGAITWLENRFETTAADSWPSGNSLTKYGDGQGGMDWFVSP